MPDGESTTPDPRRRPSYGLPGPTSPAPDAGRGEWGAEPWGTGAGQAPPPQTGPLPPGGHPGPPPRRRRGLWPLIIGLVLLLLIGPAATIGGIVWSVSSLAGDAASGPTVLEGGSVLVPVRQGRVVLGGDELKALPEDLQHFVDMAAILQR